MKKVHIIDFIDFLKTHEALARYLAAVKEQGVANLLDFGFKNMPAWSWLNCIIWAVTDEGQKYWQDLEQEWNKEIGFDPEAELRGLAYERIALEKLAEKDKEE